jgi:Tol biopolymer transport system component
VQGAFDIDSSGNVVAVERRGDDGVQLWLIDAARNVTARVDTGSDAVSSPVLSHDGARLTYIARQEGRATVIERTTRGGDRETVFDYRGEGVVYLSDRSWDGLLTLVGIAERNRRIAQLVPRGGGEAVVVAEGAVGLATARVSPDGKWVAFSSRKSGRLEVYVSPIPASGDPLQVSSAGGDYPQWRGDGHELFYIAPDGSMMSTSITTTPRFDSSSPQPLFKTGLVADQFSQRFAATGDGRRFLFNMFPEGDKPPATTTVHVVLNWAEGLARR